MKVAAIQMPTVKNKIQNKYTNCIKKKKKNYKKKKTVSSSY